jgi:two-component system phosphate regulon sensor histidine kinase PhoR
MIGNRQSLFNRALRWTTGPAVAALIASLFTNHSGVWGGVAGVALGAFIGALIIANREGGQFERIIMAIARRHDRSVAPKEETKVDPLDAAAPILDSAPIPLTILDSDGNIVFANASLRAEFDRDIIGEPLTIFMRAPELRQAINMAAQTGETHEAKFQWLHPHERHFLAGVRPLAMSDDGAAPHMALAFIERTHMKQSRRLYRDFVANASHELKTPLAALSSFLEALVGPAKNDPAAQERFLTLMAEQIKRMTSLVEDLLSLNRIELHEYLPPNEILDLNGVVDAALRELGSAKKSIAWQKPQALSFVIGDFAELSRVVVNIVDNAIRYGGERKPPLIQIVQDAERPHQIGFRCEDFGTGVPAEQVQRMTDRFFRAETLSANGSARRTAQGTGLGLAIVKHIVSRHRGELVIESKIGRGTTVTVWLRKSETDVRD